MTKTKRKAESKTKINTYMPNILSLDTSSPRCSLALQTNEHKLHLRLGTADSGLTSELPILISSILRDANLSIKDINEIILGAGPGSFTGLRVGFAFVKGISFANQIPVRLVGTLEAMSVAAEKEDGIAICANNARKGNFFVNIIEYSTGKRIILIKPSMLTQENLKMAISNLQLEHRAKPILLITSDHSQTLQPLAEGFSNLKLLTIKNLAEQIVHFQYSSFTSPDISPWSLNSLAQISPEYIQPVSAKSLAERGLGVPCFTT